LQNLENMIKAIDPSDCFVSVTTNGFLLTEERITALKKAGLDMVTISIDSASPQEHDMFRNKEGALKKAIDAVYIAKKHRIRVTINTVITHENLASGGFEDLVALCAELKVKLNILYPAMSGRWAKSTEVMITPQEKKIVQNIVNKYMFIRRDLDANYLTYGCGAVKEMIYISPYGEVMPCSFIHVLLGNIKTDSLKECIERGLQIPYFSNYNSVCPPMEDIDFIQKFMFKIAESKKIPAKLENVWNK